MHHARNRDDAFNELLQFGLRDSGYPDQQILPTRRGMYLERTLTTHYTGMVRGLCATLTLDTAVQASSAPDIVRGYEDVKLRNVQTYIARLNALGIDTALLGD